MSSKTFNNFCVIIVYIRCALSLKDEYVSEKTCFQRGFKYFKNFSFIIIFKEKGGASNLRKFNKYDQRRFIMSLVWYMRAPIWDFGICIVL